MKYKEIADKYGVSLSTVKSWKMRYDWERGETSKNVRTKSQKSMRTKSQKVRSPNNAKNKSSYELDEEDISDVIENTELTEKQRLFCIYYIQCFNATKAYQKAYECDYATASVNGSRMLRNAKVCEEIKKLKQNRLNRELITADDIFQKYLDIAMASLGDYVSFQDGIMEFKNLDETDSSIIKKITTGKTTSIELKDGMKALDWLSKHIEQATPEQQEKVDKMGNIYSFLSQVRDVGEDDV